MCREKLSSPSPFRLSHHNSNMSSSIQPVHVHFPALLEQPPIDRVRKVRLAQVAPWPFFMYVRLSMKKTYAKRGLVYPKLAQSKGSGDRMHSPDLFWGNRRVSAAPSGPEPRESVPRGMVHLSKVLVNLHRTSVPPSQPLQVSASPPSLSPFVFFGGVTSTHQLVSARQTRVRDPRIVDLDQDAFRRSRRCQWVVLGARIVPALQVRRCRRAVGGQPIHAGDRRR